MAIIPTERGRRIQVWKAQIAIVVIQLGIVLDLCDDPPYSLPHRRRRISESIFIAACSMHDYDDDRRTEECTQREI